MDRTGARLLYRSRPDERIATLFWSANDKTVWFNRLRHCSPALSLRDVSINPDTCEESDLASKALAADLAAVRFRHIRFNSSFFADNGELLFLRENVDRISNAGFNVWSLQTDGATGDLAGTPHQVSRLNGVVLSQLTGSRDGRRLAVVRIDSTTQTYLADWQMPKNADNGHGLVAPPQGFAGSFPGRRRGIRPLSAPKNADNGHGLVAPPEGFVSSFPGRRRGIRPLSAPKNADNGHGLVAPPEGFVSSFPGRRRGIRPLSAPFPLLRNQRRLTLEQTNSYPHAWTPDSQCVIFESDRNGRLELFRQNLKHREAELLVSTAGDVYMPQVTPDGKWLLMMYRDLANPDKPGKHTRHLLLRAPITGGQPVEVPLSQPLDEFRCSLPGHGTGCVLRTTQADGQRYFELDPIAGKGRELGRTAFVSTGLGRWSLSPDGTEIVVPDTHNAGRFLEIHLHPALSDRSQSWRQIEGIGRMSSISFVPDGDGWLANSPILDSTVNMALLPSFGDLFRAEGFFYIDARLQPHLISKSSTNISGVVSPDEKHMALLGADVTSNVWSFER